MKENINPAPTPIQAVPQEKPATHVLVPVSVIMQIIPFLHGQGSEMAVAIAGELQRGRAVSVEAK